MDLGANMQRLLYASDTRTEVSEFPIFNHYGDDCCFKLDAHIPYIYV